MPHLLQQLTQYLISFLDFIQSIFMLPERERALTNGAASPKVYLSPQGFYLALALPYKPAMDCTKTLRLRLKDKHASVLWMAREVNQVWNHVNAISAKAARPFDGDVASSKLDAGWSMLKTMLEYKSHQAAIVFEVVNESYSTQTCSCCGVISASSPKGRAGLRIRGGTSPSGSGNPRP